MNNLTQNSEYVEVVRDLTNKLKELKIEYKDEEVL